MGVEQLGGEFLCGSGEDLSGAVACEAQCDLEKAGDTVTQRGGVNPPVRDGTLEDCGHRSEREIAVLGSTRCDPGEPQRPGDPGRAVTPRRARRRGRIGVGTHVLKVRTRAFLASREYRCGHGKTDPPFVAALRFHDAVGDPDNRVVLSGDLDTLAG